MMKIPSMKVWASCVACLAVVVAAGGAFAQQREDPDEQQRDTQASERDQQASERGQHTRERDQQGRQREQRDIRQRERMPAPGGEAVRRDEQRFGRDEQRFARDREEREPRDGDEAGLGVQVIEDRQEGIVVSRVNPGSPAQEMGLRQGDRITHLDGQEVRSTQQFVAEIRDKDPGDEIELDVQRGQQERTLRGELETRKRALVIRGQQRGTRWGEPGRGASQTGYEETRTYGPGRQTGRDVSGQISQIEQRVNRLSREIENLRLSLREIRQQTGEGRLDRERTARYEEESEGRRDPRGARTTERWDEQQRGRQFYRLRDREQRDFDREEREVRRPIDLDEERDLDDEQREPLRDQQPDLDDEDEDNTPGGQVGRERQRPGTQDRD